MKTRRENQKATFDSDQAAHVGDHRKEDRRMGLSKGFWYISTVGWICRRERFRRKNVDRSQ